MTIEEINKKQDELRAQRTVHYDNAYKCQKEIDELELKKYDCEKFYNQYIKVLEDGISIYMYVNNVERLFSGPKFKGPRIIIYDNVEELYTFRKLGEYNCKWEESKNIQIIDKEEIKNIIDSLNIVKDYMHI